MGFPGGTVVMNPPINAGDGRYEGSIPGLGRSPEVGNSNPIQYFLPGKLHGPDESSGIQFHRGAQKVRHD